MKYHQQSDISDCGAACIAMIASHFGKTPNIAEIRQNAGTDTEGTNFQGLLNCEAQRSNPESEHWLNGLPRRFAPRNDKKGHKRSHVLFMTYTL